jgi:hypothetical protein
MLNVRTFGVYVLNIMVNGRSSEDGNISWHRLHLTTSSLPEQVSRASLDKKKCTWMI